MSELAEGGAVPLRVERRLRRAGVLLLVGLLVEAVTLLALNKPIGFLAFAGAAGLLVVVGIVLYLWAIVSQGRPE